MVKTAYEKIAAGLKEVLKIVRGDPARITIHEHPRLKVDNAGLPIACPDCGSQEFTEGPHGGICINWYCAGCESGFNVCRVGPDTHFVERIGKRQ